MKKIKLILIILISSIVLSQERIINPDNLGENYVPQKGDYIINHFVDSFVGEFHFSQNGDFFYLKLEKRKFCDSYTEICYDRLYGEMEFKQNNQVIIEKKGILNKNKITSHDFKNKPPQIMGAVIDGNKISLMIQDEVKDKSIEGTLIKLLENGKYSLKLKERGGINIIRPGKEKQKGFTLPEEMILTKVE